MSISQLNNEQINRYKRHLILPEVGTAGQLKLLNAKVLCIGAGGLGSPISLYLAAAGVGTIGMADIDVVSPSNLQRQVLFGVSTLGVDKVTAAAKRLKDLNPDCKVIEHKTIVNSSNVLDILKDYDVIIDGTDNFPTRYCVNDACVILKKPNIYGSIFRFEGMVTIFAPHLANPLRPGERGPCYRCMYPEPPDPGSVPSCAEGGVIGVLPGIIGTLQANETIKLILGIGTPAIGKLTTFSSLDFEFKTFKLRRDVTCPVCGDHPTITEPIDYEQFCGVPAMDPKSLEETKREVTDAKTQATAGAKPAAALGLDPQGLPPGYAFKPDWEVTPRETKQKLDSGAAVVIDVREPHEWDITHIVGKDLLFPRAQWPQVAAKLKGKENEKVIVHCKSGGRSLQVAQMLRQAGYKDVKSMAGGISLWNRDINPAGRNIERRHWLGDAQSHKVAPMRVRQQQIDQLRRQGYAIVPGFLTADEISAAMENVLRYVPTPEELAATPERYAGVIDDAEHLQTEFPFAGEALNHVGAHPELIALVEQVLGTREVLLSQAAMWAKYAGTGDFDQGLHLDYQGNTLVVPREDGDYRQINMILYYTDVTPELGPTFVVSQEKTRDFPMWPTHRPRKKNPELYKHEKPVLAKAGDLLIFGMKTWHRASDLTAEVGARFTHHLVYRAAEHAFQGYHQWSQFGEKAELAAFIERATPRQREVIGFPPAGDAYWNDETLAAVGLRYQGMDMRPYRQGVSSNR